MKAEELRVGNWVQIADSDRFDQVQRISEGSINGWKEDRWLPIPLSPNILERCKFVEDEGSWEIVVKKYDLNIGLIDFVEHWMVSLASPFGLVNLAPIKYLHELQNLFAAITGEQLYILR